MALISENLSTYRWMQRIPTRNSYVLRLLTLCFVGTHIPLIAACVYFLLQSDGGIASHLGDIAILLAATLVGTAFTLTTVGLSLAPVLRSSRALQHYMTTRVLPDLPTQYTDDAGQLMASVQRVTQNLEKTLREQETLASVDPLTGLFNRRAFFERALDALMATAETGGQSVAALFDIDHFKSVNDTFGHAEGDRVLRNVAQVLQNEAGSDAIVGRFGGEEFVVLWPASSPEDARGFAEAVRAGVEAMPPVEGGVQQSTISGGMSRVDGQDAALFDAALARADVALYGAKSAGRNRIASDWDVHCEPPASRRGATGAVRRRSV